MRIATARTVYRVLPTLVGLFIFVTLSATYVGGNKELYVAVLRLAGVDRQDAPFLDVSAVLAAWECTRKGVAVFIDNPCDPFRRGIGYSPLLLLGSFIPLDVNDSAKVGWGLGAAFFLSLAMLPPAREGRHLVLVLLATLSSTVIFAVERANADIALFVVVGLAASLFMRSQLSRMLCYTTVLFAASLKYYPVTLVVLCLRERLWVATIIGCFVACVFGAFLFHYYPALVVSMSVIPGGQYFGDMFGAENLPKGIAFLATQRNLIGAPSSLCHHVAVAVSYALLLIGMCLVCRRLLDTSKLQRATSDLPPAEKTFAITGSLVIVGCFFAGQSIAYRGIYLLMALPSFLLMTRAKGDVFARRLGRRASIVLICIMWTKPHLLDSSLFVQSSGGIWTSSTFLYLWLAQELAWWWLIAVMVSMLWVWAIQSRAVQELAQLLLHR